MDDKLKSISNSSAFPWRSTDTTLSGNNGISTREYFAAKAMQGLINRMNTNHDIPYKKIAIMCCKMSDAMIEALASE